MPTVPRLTSQVSTSELPGVRLTAAETPESEGAGIAEAHGQQASALAGVGAKTTALGETVVAAEMRRSNAIANLSNDSAMLAKTNDLRTRALSTRGKDAFDLPEKTDQEFSDFADQLEAAAATPEQKLYVRKLRIEHGASLDLAVRTHTYSQIQQYQGEELQSLVENSRNAAIANPTDVRRVGMELARQEDAIRTHAKDLGFGPEEVQKQVDAARSATHIGVIENLLAQEQTKTAQVYFDAAKDQINGEQIARIEKALEEGTLRKQSQQASDAILAGTYGVRADGSVKGQGYLGALKRPDGNFSSELSIGVEIDGKETEIPALVPTLTDDEVRTLLNQSPDAPIPAKIIQKATDYAKQRIAAGKSPFAGRGEANTKLAPSVERATPSAPEPPRTLREALDQAKAIEDPKLRDEVSQRLEHQFALNQVAQRQDEEAASTAAFNILDQHNGDITKIPPTAWASFSGATKSALRSYGERLAAGDTIETDWKTWYGLIDQAGAKPDDFAKLNLMNYRGRLANAQFSQLADLQLSLRNKENKPIPVLEGARTRAEIINDTLTQYGIDPKDKDKAPAIAQLRRMLDQRVDAAQADGKKVSNTEIQQTLDGLMGQSVTTPGSWWGLIPFNGVSLTEQKKRLIDMTTADIPDAERKTIEQALRDAGRSVTDQTVLDTYLNVLVRRNYKAGK